MMKIRFVGQLRHTKPFARIPNLWNKIEMKMATTTTTARNSFTQTLNPVYTTQAPSTSVTGRFINWCKGQEHNRLLWLGVALAAHGCVITPLTVMAVLMAGAPMGLFMLAMVAMGMSLVTNLAAMPTKITIPVFALSILIDIAVVIAALNIGLDIAKTYV
jgi:hypothetical protein